MAFSIASVEAIAETMSSYGGSVLLSLWRWLCYITDHGNLWRVLPNVPPCVASHKHGTNPQPRPSLVIGPQLEIRWTRLRK